MSADLHVLAAALIPAETRRYLEASGGADALRSAAEAIMGAGAPDLLRKDYVLDLLEQFARVLDEKAGPLSSTALGLEETS